MLEIGVRLFFVKRISYFQGEVKCIGEFFFIRVGLCLVIHGQCRFDFGRVYGQCFNGCEVECPVAGSVAYRCAEFIVENLKFVFFKVEVSFR
jgi:hypothetical protein